jgi:hypothetical protein
VGETWLRERTVTVTDLADQCGCPERPEVGLITQRRAVHDEGLVDKAFERADFDDLGSGPTPTATSGSEPSERNWKSVRGGMPTDTPARTETGLTEWLSSAARRHISNGIQLDGVDSVSLARGV